MNSSFFSFALRDGYISKSFEGLKHHKPPPTLLRLLLSGTVSDVHWISVGQDEETWFISYADSDGFDQIVYGDNCPSSLKRYLYDAKRRRFLRDEHIRVVFGPNSSFFAWDRSSLRWSNLPESLEEVIQDWLTPAGWKVGPPRMVAIGADDAWFILSEYGEVEYRIRKTWPTLSETVGEWEEEGFDWSELAYVSFDASKADHFVAIRNDRIWAGSIDDVNAEALESFALSFFSKPTRKPKPRTNSQTNGHSKPSQSQSQSQYPSPPEPPNMSTAPSAQDQALYESWSTSVATLLASALPLSTPNTPNPPNRRAPPKLQIRNRSSTNASQPPRSPGIPPTTAPPKLLNSFPYPPASLATCTLPYCQPSKSNPKGLRACKHDIGRLFRGSGLYSYEFLRQERLRWHPDRFGRLCEEGWREEGRRISEEMWKVIDGLMVEEQKNRQNGEATKNGAQAGTKP